MVPPWNTGALLVEGCMGLEEVKPTDVSRDWREDPFIQCLAQGVLRGYLLDHHCCFWRTFVLTVPSLLYHGSPVHSPKRSHGRQAGSSQAESSCQVLVLVR